MTPISGIWLQDRAQELKASLAFCTRLPLARTTPEKAIAKAAWALPLAGLVVGLIGALVYALSHRLGLPAWPAAALTVAATLVVTGALHEDGLADTADGFGGGNTRQQKLDIMRDSRIGTFGACALAISLLLRWSTIADIAEPRFVALALISANVAARACLPAFMHLVPPARSDGLSSGAGPPPGSSVVAAVLLGTLCLLFSFGLTGSVVALLMLVLIGFLLARLASQQFGGQTGDVLGALEQVAEVAILLIAASLF